MKRPPEYKSCDKDLIEITGENIKEILKGAISTNISDSNSIRFNPK